MLGYQQHTYTIIGIVHRYLTNYFQHIFINNNHWILVQIHESTLDLHCTIYDSNKLTMKKLPNNTIQLLINIINVKHLQYSYANVVQPSNNSSCGLLTITYAIDITFVLNPKKSIYNVPQKQFHLHNNINNKTISPSPNTYIQIHYKNKMVDCHYKGAKV